MATPPILKGPTAKERKYDRQLRLWAASGQAALEDAHVLLVNSGPGVVGVEALKNLVLPGIGQFSILDAAMVEEADLGVNFFLEEESLGKPRADETVRLLGELNPDVEGHAIVQTPVDFLTPENALDPFSLILVTAPIKSEQLKTISEHGQKTGVPVFYIHCVGFYSSFSISLPSAFPIVDTHPDPQSTTDLRLLKPWPALLEYADHKTKELLSMDDHEHGHVPYLVLILYYLEQWKQTHDGKLPSNYKEKNDFKKVLETGMRLNNPTGGEENYEQAVAAVIKNLNEPLPKASTKEVFAAEESTNLSTMSANFWVISHAMAQFYKRHGVLPLPGAVPDMKAQSGDYVELQNVYKAKAREDVAEVLQIVRSLEMGLYRTKQIEEKEVEAFCKNANHIKLVRGRPFHMVPNTFDQNLDWGERGKYAINALSDETSLILLHIAFLAFDHFYQSHSFPPGVDHSVDFDANVLADKTASIISDLNDSVLDRALIKDEMLAVGKKLHDICKELARAGGAELHNISSLTGGLVAQEAIKVITKQYIPVDNTCLFDGIKSVSSTIRI